MSWFYYISHIFDFFFNLTFNVHPFQHLQRLNYSFVKLLLYFRRNNLNPFFSFKGEFRKYLSKNAIFAVVLDFSLMCSFVIHMLKKKK